MPWPHRRSAAVHPEETESEPLIGRQRPRATAQSTSGQGWNCCAGGGLRGGTTYSSVSARADDVAQALIAELDEPVVAGDARIAEALGRLWRNAFEDDSAPPVIPSARWKALGFQGADPTTDLRAVHFAGITFIDRLLSSSNEARFLARTSAGDDELPFAISAINVLWMLRAHLALLAEPPSFCPCCGTAVRSAAAKTTGRGKQLSNSTHISPRAFVAWARLLEGDDDALFGVFRGCVLLVGRYWSARFRRHSSGDSEPLHQRERAKSSGVRDGVVHATDEFRGILSSVRAKLFSVLEARPGPGDVTELERRLLLGAVSAV